MNNEPAACKSIATSAWGNRQAPGVGVPMQPVHCWVGRAHLWSSSNPTTHRLHRDTPTHMSWLPTTHPQKPLAWLASAELGTLPPALHCTVNPPLATSPTWSRSCSAATAASRASATASAAVASNSSSRACCSASWDCQASSWPAWLDTRAWSDATASRNYAAAEQQGGHEQQQQQVVMRRFGARIGRMCTVFAS